jgi:diguanylate cyclase (GGDEF)-like protein
MTRMSSAFWALCVGALAVYFGHYALGLGPASLDAPLSDGVRNAVLVAGAAACLLRAARRARERPAWLCLGAGLACWAAADVAWSFHFARMAEPPAVSWADALWLAFYPLSWAALVLLVRSRVDNFRASLSLDGAIGALAVAAVAAAFLVEPLTGDASGTLTFAVNLAYPLGDVVLLCAVVAVFAMTGWRPGRSWALLLAGLTVNALGDAVFIYQAAIGAWEDAPILDGVFAAAVLLLAAAAWHSSGERAPLRLEGFGLLVPPLAFAVVAIGLLAWSVEREVTSAAGYLAVATLAGVLVRCALTFGENLRLADSHRQARSDELTGLPNRRALFDALEHHLDRARRAGGDVGLVVLDLDGFKELNDTLGHHAGDLLLGQIGPRLASRLRGDDLLARMGGDEFAAIVTGGDAEALAWRLREALSQPFDIEGMTVHIDASAGIAVFPEHAGSPLALLQRADVAMYQAKGDRTGVERYAAERDDHSRERLAMAGELRGAIERDEIVVHFQPQSALDGSGVRGVEALVRWQHPERGLVPPFQFLPLVEQIGLMRPLTMHVLDRSLAQCRAWLDDGTDLRVAVNLGAADLLDPRLPGDVAVLLSEHGVAADRLKLEITETIVMADPKRGRAVLDELRALGIAIALDDFGTGHSSLSYLKNLPIDELKVDRSFVMGIAGDERDAAIVRSTVQLARSLGLRVVAEGVEDAETWSLLLDLGCDEAQGYHLARPLPSEELTRWLRDVATRSLRDAA